jgi:hypothetical protein
MPRLPRPKIFKIKDTVNNIKNALRSADWSTVAKQKDRLKKFITELKKRGADKLAKSFMKNVDSHNQAELEQDLIRLENSVRPMSNDLPFRIGQQVRIRISDRGIFDDFDTQPIARIVDRYQDDREIWHYCAVDSDNCVHNLAHTRHAERVIHFKKHT